MLKFESLRSNMRAEYRLWKVYNTIISAAMHPVEGSGGLNYQQTQQCLLPASNEHVLACLDMCMEHWNMLGTHCPRLILVVW